MTPQRGAEDIWREYDAMEQRLTAPLSERLLDLAKLRPGMRVLDLATGRGEPAIAAAHRVAPDGRVLGIDASQAMLDLARARADREGVTILELSAVNAESLAGVPHAHFHATLSRWGLMYFADPVRALVAARRAMVAGGVLVAALWTDRAPYYTLPRRLLEAYAPFQPLDPEAPGTFRFASRERTRRDLAAAGFTIDHEEEHDVPVMEVKTGAELVAWCRAFGLDRLLQPLPEATQRAWETDLMREGETLRSNGVIRLGGVTRLVVAR
jgi:SAM-dependent methyltransferase